MSIMLLLIFHTIMLLFKVYYANIMLLLILKVYYTAVMLLLSRPPITSGYRRYCYYAALTVCWAILQYLILYIICINVYITAVIQNV